MPKTLDNWVLELRKQFGEETLKKHVARAKITIGLVDVTSGEIQFHALEYKAKNMGVTPSNSKGGQDDYRTTGSKMRQERQEGLD